MYLLDANVFITSKNAHYGFDIVPAFWDWLDREHAQGKWCSIDKIKQEIDAKRDQLTTWAASRSQMFVPLDLTSQASMRSIAAWTSNSSHFKQGAKQQFLASGDFQLIAYAHAHGHTVVSHEKSEPSRKDRVKIPDACLAHGVSCITPFTMLNVEGARFIL
jgi:hypothetical protein